MSATNIVPIKIGDVEIHIEADTPSSTRNYQTNENYVRDSAEPISSLISKQKSISIRETIEVIALDMEKCMEKVKAKEWSVEFSLSLESELGLYIAKTKGKGAISVSLKWGKE